MSFFKDILKCTKMHYCVVVALIAFVCCLVCSVVFRRDGNIMNVANSKCKGSIEERRIAEKIPCAINFGRRFFR